MIVTFGGGVGAGKFLEGLYKVTKKKDNLHIVVNTADDINIYGVCLLYTSPSPRDRG